MGKPEHKWIPNAQMTHMMGGASRPGSMSQNKDFLSWLRECCVNGRDHISPQSPSVTYSMLQSLAGKWEQGQDSTEARGLGQAPSPHSVTFSEHVSCTSPMVTPNLRVVKKHVFCFYLHFPQVIWTWTLLQQPLLFYGLGFWKISFWKG